MPYDVLETKIKNLPPEYYNELIDFLEFLTLKAQQNQANAEDVALKKMRETSLESVWETIKNDTW